MKTKRTTNPSPAMLTLLLVILGYALWAWYGVFIGLIAGWSLNGLRSCFNDLFIFRWRRSPPLMHHYFSLALVVMKAGGEATPAAVAYIEQFFSKNFGRAGRHFLTTLLQSDSSQERLRVIRCLASQEEIQVEISCRQIREGRHEENLRALRFLFGLACANGQLSPGEFSTLEQITFSLGILTHTFNALCYEFIESNGDYNGDSSSENASEDNADNPLDNKKIRGGKEIQRRPPSDDTPPELSPAARHLFTLALAVMKAGGVLSPAAIHYIEQTFSEDFGTRGDQFLAKCLGSTDKQARTLAFQRLVSQEIPLETPCRDLKYMCISDRLYALHFLFSVAGASCPISQVELAILEQITSLIGMTKGAFNTLRREFCGGSDDSDSENNNDNTRDDNHSGGREYFNRDNGNSNGYHDYDYDGNDDDDSWEQTPFDDPLYAEYALLDIPPTATDEEVKKAYRTAVKKYHPDNFSREGEAAFAAAEQTFAIINDAYEEIKRSRGL
ncbi:MAG: TerB family tellurite resistance protein [Odoribacteraceae bacterium]|jgi:DnaJ-domain-containing protein 1|nr:TerB family tellurite resistance protein [Odoribacteraceae bacterium]